MCVFINKYFSMFAYRVMGVGKISYFSIKRCMHLFEILRKMNKVIIVNPLNLLFKVKEKLILSQRKIPQVIHQ